MLRTKRAKTELQLTSDLKEDLRIVISKEGGVSALEAPWEAIVKSL